MRPFSSLLVFIVKRLREKRSHAIVVTGSPECKLDLAGYLVKRAMDVKQVIWHHEIAKKILVACAILLAIAAAALAERARHF